MYNNIGKNNEKQQEELKKAMDSFLQSNSNLDESQELDCSSGVCVIKNDKSILERINKKIITEDGRQLLI